MAKHISLKPKLSEKTYAQSMNRVYAFEVPRDVNKHTIARAVEAQFEVKVTEVNVTNHKGKAKRTISQGGRRVANGREAATKKAYVTLAEGFSLPFFAAIEEAEEKQENVQAQVDKAAAKTAAKEAKQEVKAEKPKRVVSKKPAQKAAGEDQ
jgi:large subunit ribosomal protein L23